MQCKSGAPSSNCGAEQIRKEALVWQRQQQQGLWWERRSTQQQQQQGLATAAMAVADRP